MWWQQQYGSCQHEHTTMFLVANGSGCRFAMADIAHLDDGDSGTGNDLQS